MNHLFLFTITPVQDFISQSRKLLDLYGSSSILSCMSEIGIMICNREKGKTVFPYYDKKNSSNSYPNRFLVEFENKSLDDIKNIAKVIESSLQKFLKGLNSKNHQKIYEHIENYFSFYWAISEIENNDYKKAFDIVEKRLAGAKNTRFFNQLGSGNGERGRKCSICGERNVTVAGKKLYKKLQLKKYDKLLSPNEGLCEVCYIKRDYGKKLKIGFESTADIALMNIPLEIREEFNYLHDDSQLFYEENLNKDYFEKNYSYPFNECLKEFQKFREAIKGKYKQTSYYAVIMFDGDNMGKWLSGNKKIKGKELYKKINLQEFHTSLSEKLMDFANNVKKIDNIVTVYAGGEDFLGFVNINYLFRVLRLLRCEWNKKVNRPLKKEFDLSENFTFSAGVVVAHYKTPLSEVLKSARGAEKKAKDTGRDRICFRVLKRSGAIREGILEYKKLLYLKEIKDEITKHDISDSFISHLEKEFLIMCEENGELRLSRRSSMLKAEIIRLLQRRKSANQKFDEKFLSEKILKLTSNNFRIFIHLLYIVKFLKREVYVNSH